MQKYLILFLLIVLLVILYLNINLNNNIENFSPSVTDGDTATVYQITDENLNKWIASQKESIKKEVMADMDTTKDNTEAVKNLLSGDSDASNNFMDNLKDKIIAEDKFTEKVIQTNADILPTSADKSVDQLCLKNSNDNTKCFDYNHLIKMIDITEGKYGESLSVNQLNADRIKLGGNIQNNESDPDSVYLATEGTGTGRKLNVRSSLNSGFAGLHSRSVTTENELSTIPKINSNEIDVVGENDKITVRNIHSTDGTAILTNRNINVNNISSAGTLNVQGQTTFNGNVELGNGTDLLANRITANNFELQKTTAGASLTDAPTRDTVNLSLADGYLNVDKGIHIASGDLKMGTAEDHGVFAYSGGDDKYFELNKLQVTSGNINGNSIDDFIKPGPPGPQGPIGEQITKMRIKSGTDGKILEYRLGSGDFKVADGTIVGPKGDRGEPGDIGATGEQGPKGEPGTDGANGEDGTDGTDGTDGNDGNMGPPGAKGSIGESGPQGPPGPPGQVGVQGSVGPEGAQGPKGPPGVPGAKGQQGAPGMAGAHTHGPGSFKLSPLDSSSGYPIRGTSGGISS